MTDVNFQEGDESIVRKYKDNGDGSYIEYVDTSILPTPDSDLTQLITVTTSGVAVQGPDKSCTGGWLLTALPTNTGYTYFMYHGQTKANKGFPFGAGQVVVASVSNLNSLDFDADSSNSKILAAKLIG